MDGSIGYVSELFNSGGEFHSTSKIKEGLPLSSIYVLIPLAILLVSIAIGVFFWAVKSNQFEDLERHGSSILFDDDLPKKIVKPKLDPNKNDE